MRGCRAFWFLCVVAILWTIGAVAFAQAPAGPAFEVASVKANTSDDQGGFIGFVGGQFRVINWPLQRLIGVAYADPQPLPPFRVIGSPTWIDTARFDIVAKPDGSFLPEGPPVTQQFLMLRGLLIERFKLLAHHEKRELPIYELVLARADGRLGPQLHKSDVDCEAFWAARRGNPPPPPPLTDGPPPACFQVTPPGRIAGSANSMDQLLGALSLRVNRPVVNKTGLQGVYDFDLRFTLEQLPTGAPPPGAPPLPIDSNVPSIFTALQEQLGLKLEPQKGPVDVLVIDRIEQPTEN